MNIINFLIMIQLIILNNNSKDSLPKRYNNTDFFSVKTSTNKQCIFTNK